VLVAAFAAKPRDVSSSSCDHGHSARNQIGGKPSKSIIFTVRPTVFDRNILTLDISSLVQTTSESSDVLRRLAKRPGTEKPDDRHRRLLRARGDRPSRYRAGQNAEKSRRFMPT